MGKAFKGTPDKCRDCGCVAWHVLKDGTDINTAEEAYVCITPGCGCTHLADEMDPGKGYKRINHAWHYA
jgi:hypothetical protein